MKSALLVALGKDLEVESLDPLAPGPRDVVVAVGASGICHTDLSVRNGLFPALVSGPMIGGHEGAGTVVEVGDQVTRVAVGDRVIASFRPACGTCAYCLSDRSHLCDSLGGFLRTPRARRQDGSEAVAMSGIGTFSDVLTCNEASVVRIRSELPDAHLALLGCGMTTGVGAVLFTAKVRPGSTVAVVGCGGVGQSVVQGAAVAGAARIIAVDPVESKRRTARKLGATDVVDPAAAPPDAQVKELLKGGGVDYAFDVVGTPDIVASTYRMVGKGGTLVLVGYGPMDGEFRAPAFDLQAQEKTVKGCVAGSAQVRRDYQMFVDLIESGRLSTGALVTQEIALTDVNTAMDALLKGEVIRSVITAF
ncbi:zinc-binding dehydrogenase [Cryptosporangium sp. NPDC051539]|uniref:zinc-binding dehydrogenase n=1 Tax=Cryptosporangium sp. NPDC051539 TaxID=3363962 RepID=UPI0037A34C43